MAKNGLAKIGLAKVGHHRRNNQTNRKSQGKPEQKTHTSRGRDQEKEEATCKEQKKPTTCEETFVQPDEGNQQRDNQKKNSQQPQRKQKYKAERETLKPVDFGKHPQSRQTRSSSCLRHSWKLQGTGGKWSTASTDCQPKSSHTSHPGLVGR